MGSEQGKVVKQINYSPNKQIKSSNQFEDQAFNDPASPSKNPKPKSSTNISIEDLQQQMNLEQHELIEIMDYLKKHKYFLDQTILGKGGNGFVLKGIDSLNQKVAIKVLKCETEDQYVQNTTEYQNQKQCNSKYVVKVKDLLHYHNQKSSLQFLIMERCLTDLKQFMKDKLANNIWMSKKYIYETCLQLVLGLQAIHSKNVLHLDIKPANLLLGLDLKWKYTDLGVSKNVNEEIDHTVNLKGITACYSSPEQYQLYQFQSNKKITKQCDIYSLGVVFMELTGVDVRKKWVIKQKVRHKPFDKYLNEEFQEFNDVILKNMLQYNSNSRISLEELELVLKNLISTENKEKKIDSLETQDESCHNHKSVTFIAEDSSPAKRQQKSIHQKSFSTSSEEKQQNQQQQQIELLQPQQSLQQQQIYSNPKQSHSPLKRIIIPVDKIQSYNYSIRQNNDSPDNSPLKKRSVKIISRSNKIGGSQTPISNGSNNNNEPHIFVQNASLTPNKQRISNGSKIIMRTNQDNHNNSKKQLLQDDDQEYGLQQQQQQSSQLKTQQNRRAFSMHSSSKQQPSAQQDILPPIIGQNRIQHMNNIAYSQSPSPIYIKRSFIQNSNSNQQQQQQQSQQLQQQQQLNNNNQSNQNSLANSSIFPNNQSNNQSPLNTNKKSSSKSFSQKIIIPKKLIPTNFQQASQNLNFMMTKSQFDHQFLVSN